ncbi:putative pentatricopeptide repeat-containing protein [Cucumis melo var. makuwa]|uniref:Putative pentatricopeptide repeat-containing protein n=1 Tax=Cucumis melo var. makuwa TaxID=1194695 RepID=A0A5D3D457_CUCMM|nr:putative pentatricopeptide repeat-containing protein [Cucumis melo var. makuwa]
MNQRYYTIMSFLEKCKTMKELKQIQSLMIKTSVVNNIIPCSRLIDFCANSELGDNEYARTVFDQIDQPTVYVWNSMIKGYCNGGDKFGALFMYEEMQRFVNNDQPKEALRLFKDMENEGVEPNEITMTTALAAAAHCRDIYTGKLVRNRLRQLGFDPFDTNSRFNVILATAIMDMYAKCGKLVTARNMFDKMPQRNLVVWNSMVSAYSQYGRGAEALRLFVDMELAGFVPNKATFFSVIRAYTHLGRMEEEAEVASDQITYIAVLWACSHLGLVEEGQKHFTSMTKVYGIEPTMEHYGCMIDLLSRAGHSEEAEELPMKMPTQPNATILSSILNDCEMYGNVGLANRVKSHMVELKNSSSGVYVLLSNIHAKACNWEEMKLARDSLKHKKIGKTLGNNFVEINLLP